MWAPKTRLRRRTRLFAALGATLLLAGRFDLVDAASDEKTPPAVRGAAGRTIEQKNAAAKPGVRRMELVAVHKESGKPFPSVGIEVEYRLAGAQGGRFKRFLTDAHGRAVFEYPSYAVFTAATILAQPLGFVPAQIRWMSTGPAIALPDKVQLELEPGTTIGGVVRSEEHTSELQSPVH